MYLRSCPFTHKIAFFTDAHANLPATQAALAALEEEGYDELYHLGDAIAIGPFPSETLDLLLNAPRIHFVRGNHDQRFLKGIPDPPPPHMASGEAVHQRWTHAQLDPALRDEVAKWPWKIETALSGVLAVFQHYAFAQNGEGKEGFAEVVRSPTAADMDRMFGEQEGSIICHGHNHSASEVQGRRWYINPGSLGCSGKAVARYAVLERSRVGYKLEYRHVPYDDRPLFEAFEKRQVPEREFIYRAFMGRRWPR